MKVLIITLHHVRNFGSMLQTYALQSVLEKQNMEVEVIDFIPKGFKLYTGISTIRGGNGFLKDSIRKIAATGTFGIRQLIMISFNHKYIHLSSKSYGKYKDLLMNPPNADIYISGSDQIWNTQNSNEIDDIKAYYLQFGSQEVTRISYASSIGKTVLSEEEKQNVKEWLKLYSALSVREKHAQKILHEIGLRDIQHVLDPTLLLTKNEWLKFMKSKYRRFKSRPYIFVYNLNRNRELKEYAMRLSKNKKIEIVNFADTLDFIQGAKNRIVNTAFDFLYYIYNAKYVLTDSFHGTAFSINFNKQFVVFSAPKYNSRIESILNLFCLTNRLYSDEKNIDLIDNLIDYDKVNKILEEERKKSMTFLLNNTKERRVCDGKKNF